MGKKALWCGAAVDIGASGGKVFLGHFDGEFLIQQEVHRFRNEPVRVLGTLYWDILNLYRELSQGLHAVVRRIKEDGFLLSSLGIDSWAVDFGLLDKSGALVGNPVHYRDGRTAGVMERVMGRLGAKTFFEMTGIQFLPFNTVYQLVAMLESQDPHIGYAETLLLIPDLLAYFLTGERGTEFTNATTTQLLNVHTRNWNTEVMERLGIPERIFSPIHAPGQSILPLRSDVANEMGVGDARLVSVATHDTASAVVAVPSRCQHFAYISSGTWSLMGTEVDHPILTEESLRQGFTNEGGFDGRYRLLKNIMGLWLLQELQREWEAQGQFQSWQTLMQKAASAPALTYFIDPDDPRFLSPGAMTVRIAEFCRETNQNAPISIGEFVRTVLESLALKYRWTLQRLEGLLNHSVDVLHIVGGGSQNVLLCQWTANACHRLVVTGPMEASAVGNLLVQLMTAGEVRGITEARELTGRSFPLQEYQPVNPQTWDEAYTRFQVFIRERFTV